MVATTDHRASRIGVDVLEGGGNAVDAAVATSFALAVVNPEAGNVGGSGFMVVRSPDGSTYGLDYRSVAPRAATPDMFANNRGERDDASQLGHLAVAVPGAVRGLWDAHRRFGSLPWAHLVQPAIELAHGFAVDDRLRRSYEPHIVDGLGRFAASAEIFLPGGTLPVEGSTFHQPDLARTLERIRDGGADGFYAGETADLIVEEMRKAGGVLTHDDLAAYGPAWREPLRIPYRGQTIVSMPPSSSGGITLAAMAHVLSCFDMGALPWHGTRHVHLMSEAWRRAFADRNGYLADPDHVTMPLEVLCSPGYGRHRAASISFQAATPSAELWPGAEAYSKERHTTHVSIVAPDGGAVSLTTTLNTWYGSKVVAKGTGVLLNNEMDDFTARPGVPNHFGLVQGEANVVAPGKRMLSAMTPTLVLDSQDRLSLVLGAPGGSTIMTTVFQVISNIVDHAMSPADAVAAPRLHHQHLPDQISIEPAALPAAVVSELRGLGHAVKEADEVWGDVELVAQDDAGVLQGVADPRRGGTALGL
jgi:gamma-glutamyltranspeptidase/glutathione hydrolase